MNGTVLLVKSPWLGAFLRFLGRPSIVILLNGHSLKLPSELLCLCLQTWGAFNLIHRNFFLWWVTVSGEMCTGQCAGNKMLNDQPYMGHLYQPAITKAQAPWRERRCKEYKSQMIGKSTVKFGIMDRTWLIQSSTPVQDQYKTKPVKLPAWITQSIPYYSGVMVSVSGRKSHSF